MRKSIYVLCGFFLLSLSAAVSRQANSPEKKMGPTIQVQLNYSGSGTVDEKHKIFVALWDSPSFMEPDSHTMPVAIQSTTSKTGTVTFSDVQKVPAYVSTAYDPSGNWDSQSGPPPSGSSLGMYSKTPGKPEPINGAQGEKVKVELSFDDSVKMP